MATDQEAPASLAVGAIIDKKYEIERVLGEGGMGVVYLARDKLTETRVVLKAVLREHAHRTDYRERILAEGRALARIDHPNVVRLNAMVVEGDALYLVMQYIEGESVDAIIQRHFEEGRPVPVREALRIFRQAAQGVAAAHREGIIHRDLKPANILVRARDGAVKVTDFGIAKLEEDAKVGRGKTRGIIGSIAYMAPEQCTGRRDIDKRVDIYSLGVVLFELLTGKLPFDADGSVEIMRMHVEREIPPVSAERGDVPKAIDDILRRACAKRPEDRFASCDELLAALERVVIPEEAAVRPGGAAAGAVRAGAAAGAVRAGAADVPSTVPGGPPIITEVPAAAAAARVPPPATATVTAEEEGGGRGSTLRFGLLLGAVGALGVVGAYAMGWLDLDAGKGDAKRSATPAAAPTATAAPTPTMTAAPPATAAATATASAPPAQPTASATAKAGDPAAPDLSGVWTSDKGRVYDVALVDSAYAFRIRDPAQFPQQGYEAGEARFLLRPIPGEMETYLVEDRIRPFPPEGTRYDAKKARPSCVEVWKEVSGRPLRAQLDGKKLWVRMALLEPAASMFVRKGALVVGCTGLNGAPATEVDSFLTRKK